LSRRQYPVVCSEHSSISTTGVWAC
jgi:hypothetical protein